jgi:hypothetical protein
MASSQPGGPLPRRLGQGPQRGRCRRPTGLPSRRDPLDANPWRRGRWRSLGQVAVRWQLAGGAVGRLRCCTYTALGLVVVWVCLECMDQELGQSTAIAAIGQARGGDLPDRSNTCLDLRRYSMLPERTIRPVKVQQRSSGGCWRTIEGLADFAIVHSYLSTASSTDMPGYPRPRTHRITWLFALVTSRH